MVKPGRLLRLITRYQTPSDAEPLSWSTTNDLGVQPDTSSGGLSGGQWRSLRNSFMADRRRMFPVIDTANVYRAGRNSIGRRCS